MGRGEIITHYGNAEYRVRVKYRRDRFAAMIASLELAVVQYAALIATKESEIILEDDPQKKARLIKTKKIYELQKTSCEKRIQYLESNMPADPEMLAWCVDRTEDLSGEVGTIEVPGEIGTVLIKGGYDGGEAFEATDGVLTPVVANKAAAAFYNLAMMPGWQRWMPTFRFGQIQSIDRDAGTAEIELDYAVSSLQSLNINPIDLTLYDVPFEYMSCNDAAFEDGDNVLIKFENQSWDTPKVVGFKDNPKPCGWEIKLTRGDGTLVDGDALMPSFHFYKSDETPINIFAEYIPAPDGEPPTAGYWRVIVVVDEENPFVPDDAGYFLTYSLLAQDAIPTQYPGRYKTADLRNPADLVPFGEYEDEIPYWKTEESEDVFEPIIGDCDNDTGWIDDRGTLPINYVGIGTKASYALRGGQRFRRTIRVWSSVPYEITWGSVCKTRPRGGADPFVFYGGKMGWIQTPSGDYCGGYGSVCQGGPELLLVSGGGISREILQFIAYLDYVDQYGEQESIIEYEGVVAGQEHHGDITDNNQDTVTVCGATTRTYKHTYWLLDMDLMTISGDYDF